VRVACLVTGNENVLRRPFNEARATVNDTHAVGNCSRHASRTLGAFEKHDGHMRGWRGTFGDRWTTDVDLARASGSIVNTIECGATNGGCLQRRSGDRTCTLATLSTGDNREKRRGIAALGHLGVVSLCGSRKKSNHVRVDNH
jgi:hypothetical protein